MDTIDIGTTADDKTGMPVRPAFQRVNENTPWKVPTIAALQANTDIKPYIVNLLGYSSSGDGGEGQFWRDTSDTTSADNGGTVIVDAAGQRWKRLLFSQPVTPEMCGAVLDGVANDSAAINRVIAAAIARDQREIPLNGTAYCPDILTDRSNVIFVGSGRLTGAGAYRRQVVPADAPRLPPAFGPADFDPQRHLAQFHRTSSPVVVMMGDSLSTYDANTLGRQDMLFEMLRARFVADNPQKSISFYDRAIAGQTWGEANGTPTNTSYSWYSVPTDHWLDYIEYVDHPTDTIKPDVVVLAFGMNDKQAFSYFSFQQVIAKIQAWTKVPDIIVCTPLVPTLEPDAAWASYGTKADQVGRDYAAGYMRTYCRANGIGLLDFNRMMNIVRDGRDICESYLERVETDLDVSATGGYIAAADDECSDFRLDFTLSGTAAELDDMFDGTLGTLAIRLTGAQNNDGYIKFTKNGGGTIQATVVSHAGNTVLDVDTAIAVPTADTTFIFEKYGQRLTLRKSDGPSVADLWAADNVKLHGGEFPPSIGWYETLWTTGPVSTLSLNVGRYRQYMPSILNDDMWGEGLASSDTQLPYGGNGINHPTSRGALAVYGTLLGQVSFAGAAGALRTYDAEYPLGGGYMGSRAPDGSATGDFYMGCWGTNGTVILGPNGVPILRLNGAAVYPVGAQNLGSSTNAWTKLFAGKARFTACPQYADNASALAGGLAAGDVYRTTTGEVRIVV